MRQTPFEVREFASWSARALTVAVLNLTVPELAHAELPKVVLCLP